MLYLRLIILSVRYDVPINSEAVLVTDFVNLKIKSAQSLEGTHRSMMYICVHKVSDRIYIWVSIFILF
jgi:hypothetical protein